MNKLAIVIFAALFLPGCTLLGFGPKEEPPIEIEKRVQPIPVFHPPLPETVVWQEVEWTVLTPETMQEYLDAYDAGEARAMVFYGLTPEGYRALSENVADIQRYIRQSNTLLLYYRENLVEIIIEQVEVPAEVDDEDIETIEE